MVHVLHLEVAVLVKLTAAITVGTGIRRGIGYRVGIVMGPAPLPVAAKHLQSTVVAVSPVRFLSVPAIPVHTLHAIVLALIW